MKILKGDTVTVIAGDDKGKTGKVLRVFPKKNKIIVEGIHFLKRHTRRSQQNPQGGIVEKEAPLHTSNVMLTIGGKRTRVKSRFLEDGKKIRVAKTTNEDIDR